MAMTTRRAARPASRKLPFARKRHYACWRKWRPAERVTPLKVGRRNAQDTKVRSNPETGGGTDEAPECRCSQIVQATHRDPSDEPTVAMSSPPVVLGVGQPGIARSFSESRRVEPWLEGIQNPCSIESGSTLLSSVRNPASRRLRFAGAAPPGLEGQGAQTCAASPPAAASAQARRPSSGNRQRAISWLPM